MQGRAGPAARGPPRDGEDGGQRTGSIVNQRHTDLRRQLDGAQLQPVLSMVLDEVFIVF